MPDTNESTQSARQESDETLSSRAPEEPLLIRLHRAFGPLIGGIILDAVDFLTFGPVGIVLGFVIGSPIGWWISSIYGFSTRTRWLIAFMAGFYCTIPFTELIPLATIIAAFARFYYSPVIPVISASEATKVISNDAQNVGQQIED